MRPELPTHPEDDRLLELAYGELPAADARALRTHVEGCPRCRTVLDGIAEVRTAFRSIPPEPAPDRGLESLLAYGEQAAARARSRRGGLRILGVLSAVTALSVVWLVLPPANRESEVAARAPVSRPSDALARAGGERAPAQGDQAADELREKDAVASAPAPAQSHASGKMRPAPAVPPAPAPSVATAAPEVRQRELAKRDAPAENQTLAQAPAVARAEMPAANPAEAKAKGNTSGDLAGAGAMSMKKSAASPPAAASEEARARDAAKVAAAPLSGALSSKATLDAAARTSAPQPAMRVGLGTPEQQARLAEIQRKLPSARGDERKALLMAQCELEASLGRGPDAVLSCSNVAREFPGTPEATRASELARGFSVQPPLPPDDR